MKILSELSVKLRDYFWPRMGWYRYCIYLWHRLFRLARYDQKGVALGFSCGVVIAVTPFMGFHFILSGLLAFFLRGNVVAGLIGSILGNPWTFPFFWWLSYKIGIYILGDAYPPAGDLVGVSLHHLLLLDPKDWFVLLSDVFFPITVGSAVLGPVLGVLTYCAMRRFLRYRFRSVKSCDV